MKYLIIDASLHGTGIRDYYEGGYILPQDLNLSKNIKDRLEKFLSDYEDEHYNNYSDEETIKKLDEEGKEIALVIKNELQDIKMSYFSDAEMKMYEL